LLKAISLTNNAQPLWITLFIHHQQVTFCAKTAKPHIPFVDDIQLSLYSTNCLDEVLHLLSHAPEYLIRLDYLVLSSSISHTFSFSFPFLVFVTMIQTSKPDEVYA
jgi:hypothetical protein